MDAIYYQKTVLARASNKFYSDTVPHTDLIRSLYAAKAVLATLDPIKKGLFYGKRKEFASYTNENEYNTRCENNPVDIPSSGVQLLHAVLGIATELEELIDVFMQHIDLGMPLDAVNVKEELGDNLWYVALAADALACAIPDLMRTNNAKLEKRFGPAFSEDKAINRNLVEERKSLGGE